MPAPKMVWIYDGHIDRYPSVLTADSVHQAQTCLDCHDGTEGESSRALSHVGDFHGVPISSDCVACHAAQVATADTGLHTTLAGYPAILAQRGFDPLDPTSAERLDAQCTKCHTAASDPPEAACGQCHVSVPVPAGGGLLAGHAFQGTPSMDRNCTACHGSRVKDEFYGLNNALLAIDKQYLDDGVPWKDAGYSLVADVHKTAGMECVDCHVADEMHGVGHPLHGDRYAVTSAPSCEAAACHPAVLGSTGLHTAGHLDAMACQVCHAQPYKNCFECHTDVDEDDFPFYSISDGDPSGEHNHLMTFRVGKNPKYPGGATERPYAVLRHVPVDVDVFTYSGANMAPGLLPNMTDSPTWKFATPHNIQRVTPIQSACSNCHGPDYARFWLTDAISNAQGWISPTYEADETTANAGVIVDTQLPMSLPRGD